MTDLRPSEERDDEARTSAIERMILDFPLDPTNGAQALKELAEAILALDQHPKSVRGLPPERALFAKDLDSRTQAVAAIAMLRLLTREPAVFSDKLLRSDLVKLFDSAFKHEIYSAVNTSVGDQGYEKLERLKQGIDSAEQSLTRLPVLLTGIGTIRGARRELMKAINQPVAARLVKTFVPRHLVERVKLDDVLGPTDTYVSGNRSLEEYQIAKDKLDEYVEELRLSDSSYVTDVLLPYVCRLDQLITEDFDNSPQSKPAVVVVEGLPKKYPLQEIGAAFPLTFILRNDGEGYAKHLSVQFDFMKELRSPTKSLYLGDLAPSETVGDVDVPIEVVDFSANTIVIVTASWQNFDGTRDTYEGPVEFESQQGDVPWDELEATDPYSLEPVTDEDDLVGRSEVLKLLDAKLSTKRLSSFFIFGQKRVGKTSVVKTLRSRMRRKGEELLMPYIESGSYVNPDPIVTVEQLGAALCRALKQCDSRLSHLEIPDFKGALSPVTTFLDEVDHIVTARIVFVLDEFDELPIVLYQQRPNPLFQTIRALSARDNVAFLLVGGEKMQPILTAQGDVLNKFTPQRIDYFDKDKHYSDFIELVRRPVREWIEISDEAVARIYDESAGNPFFAKLVCSELFQQMLKRRDRHVTGKEVAFAVKAALSTIGHQVFQHFWDDGILAEGDKQREKSIIRRRVLLALAEGLRGRDTVSLNQLQRYARQYEVPESLLEEELAEFVRRQVLVEDGGHYRCKVKFFGRWLAEQGLHDILTEYSDRDAMLRRKRDEEKSRVQPEEIVDLVSRWGLYKGRQITEDRVRKWLSQFGPNSNQRLAYLMARGIRFYTADQIRAKLSEAHGILQRSLKARGYTLKLPDKQRKRSDIVISYLGGPEKSGVQYAQLYQEENDIYAKSIIERGKLRKSLENASKDIVALVFVDDFIGTGQQAESEMKDIMKECGDILNDRKILVMLVAVAGYQTAQDHVIRAAKRFAADVEIRICDPLSERDRFFSDTSVIFHDYEQRLAAEAVARAKGMELVKNNPLGFGEAQAPVVFEYSCPNNTLPIFWSTANDWYPIFKR